jgi:hypothetical protein
LLVGAVGAILLTLLALVGGEDTKSGPDPIDFYNEYGGAEPTEFSKQLIADLGRALRRRLAGGGVLGECPLIAGDSAIERR